MPKVDTPRTGKTDLGSVLVDAFMDSLSQGRQFVESLPNMLKVVNEVGGKIVSPGGLADLRKMAAPPTPLNGTISSERSYATVSLSMSRVKAVAAKAGVKLNDVVLAISSGVLRQHLLNQHALPNKSLTAFVPISTRDAGDTSASNQVMGMICQLATDIGDPKARLETIFAESAKAKELSSPLKQLMPLVTDTVALGSPMGIQVLSLFYSRSNLANVLPPAVNVAISNVFGPKFTLYANGAELLHSYPVSIVTHGMGLNITLQSYRDWLDFGFIAGANILPDTQAMANALPGELALLERPGLPCQELAAIRRTGEDCRRVIECGELMRGLTLPFGVISGLVPATRRAATSDFRSRQLPRSVHAGTSPGKTSAGHA